MIVMIPPEVEKKLVEMAARKRVDPALLVASLIEKESGHEYPASATEQTSATDDFDPEALNRAVAALINRTPEQKQAARERAIQTYRPQNELPAHVSPLEVLPVIRGDETDEQVLQALKDLS